MPTICLITALPAEARPLLSHFGMQNVAHPHLKIYKNKDNVLLQCGVGKLNAAIATATMLQAFPDVAAIINVGIAGSQRPLGEVLLAHQVQDSGTSQQWFPHLPPVRQLANLDTLRVLTVDKPSDAYTKDTAFDMEASGIFAAASKILDIAFVHSIKVVSDNEQSSIASISAESVSENMTNAIPSVEQLMSALPFEVLPANAEAENLVDTLCQNVHYTETERHAVKQLILRHAALRGAIPDKAALLEIGNAKAIRHKLNTDIDSANLTY